jgi:hypothetical protein
MEASLEESAVDSVPLTKPKKVVSQKQLESMAAGREILKQKRELAKAQKVLEATGILSKHKQSIPQQEKEEKEIKLEPVKMQIDEKSKKEKQLQPIQIPDEESDSEPEQEVIIMKKKKKPKPPKITYKYISDSDSSDSDAPPPAKKQLQKPARAVINQKQIRQPAPSIFCD